MIYQSRSTHRQQAMPIGSSFTTLIQNQLMHKIFNSRWKSTATNLLKMVSMLLLKVEWEALWATTRKHFGLHRRLGAQFTKQIRYGISSACMPTMLRSTCWSSVCFLYSLEESFEVLQTAWQGTSLSSLSQQHSATGSSETSLRFKRQKRWATKTESSRT